MNSSLMLSKRWHFLQYLTTCLARNCSVILWTVLTCFVRPALCENCLPHHYEKSYTGMNVFRKGMNSFRNGMNMFRTGMKTFQIGIWGNQNYQKIRNFSGSKNLKEFFQNSKFLKSSYQTKPNLKSCNFEKILSDSYSLKNFWFFDSFGFPEFQYLSGMFSFRFSTYSFRSGMNSYLCGIHSFRCNFSHSGRHEIG